MKSKVHDIQVSFLKCRLVFSVEGAFSLTSFQISESAFVPDTKSAGIPGELAEIIVALEKYMDGKLEFLPIDKLDLSNLTEFEEKALCELRRNVLRGKTTTYGELAKFTGSPNAARAVGNAMGKNPFPLFFPCHRVIRADGSAGSFSSGNRLKIKLLASEGKIIL